MSLLKTIGIGRLTANPEVRMVKVGANEIPVVNFTVAVDKDFGDKTEPDWVRCTAWRQLAETAANHLTKGRLIFFEGRPQNKPYSVVKDGVEFTQQSVEIQLDNFQFLDTPNKNANVAPAAPAVTTEITEENAPF